jgi:hypothetical protein
MIKNQQTIGGPAPLMKQTGNRFDIRHKETLTLFLKEYFELFFPDLVDKINFETARFLDKELNALFEEAGTKQPRKDRQRIADALILVEVLADMAEEQILIYWEHHGDKPREIQRRAFHCFCGVFFKFKKPVFPIVMFTDPAKWRKPVEKICKIEIFGRPVNEFAYQQIKLKYIPAEKFEKKAAENPLAAAYPPLTDYPKKDRPLIKAKAFKGIAAVEEGPRRSVLYSLIDHSLPLEPDEEKAFRKIIQENPIFQEAKMLQSIEEVGIEKGMDIGIEKGMDIGIEKGMETAAINLLRSQWLNKEQILEITGLDQKKLEALEKRLQSESGLPG